MDLFQALQQEKPLQIAGVVNMLVGLIAQEAGFRALYVSGAGVANTELAVPDLGLTSLDQVFQTTFRLTSVVSLPVLVDGDTGWGDPGRAVTLLAKAGAAGVHLEDQVPAKRCGHRPGKQLFSIDEMVERLTWAVAARPSHFAIMVRSDAFANEGMEGFLKRCKRYVEAGADMIFAEALPSWNAYKCVTEALPAPVLANMTEFGVFPLLTVPELTEAGVAMILYPLTVMRAMHKTARDVLQIVRQEGTQKDILSALQTGESLYQLIHYAEQEKRQ